MEKIKKASSLDVYAGIVCGKWLAMVTAPQTSLSNYYSGIGSVRQPNTVVLWNTHPTHIPKHTQTKHNPSLCILENAWWLKANSLSLPQCIKPVTSQSQYLLLRPILHNNSQVRWNYSKPLTLFIFSYMKFFSKNMFWLETKFLNCLTSERSEWFMVPSSTSELMFCMCFVLCGWEM